MKAEIVTSAEAGYFEIYAQPPGGERRRITMFRDAPVEFDQLRKQDPFSDVSMSLNLPQVTLWDKPGYGDLDWLVPYCNIDVVWVNTGLFDIAWTWEGFVVSINYSQTGETSSLSLECKGALYKLDNFLAAPIYPRRPIPYEVLIKQIFSDPRYAIEELSPLDIKWPDDWSNFFPEWKEPRYFSYLKPFGVSVGDKWTGLTTRSTGSWDPVLTGYVQGLLSVMFDEGGAQWTIRRFKGRKPKLLLREIPVPTDPNIIEVDLLSPGIEVTASRDFTQSANVIFGEGQDLAGTVFTGMQVSPDGRTTEFTPFAYSPLVYPNNKKANPSRDYHLIPKQSHIRFPQGLSGTQVTALARSQLKRFADPGITGTLKLTTDPRRASGEPVPRFLVSAGDTIRIIGMMGSKTGVLVHASESVVSKDGSISITFDSKYRDQLTVAEVQSRTRDAMTPLRSLQTGKYSNTIQDLILPWSYEEGSGAIPIGSRSFFNRIPAGVDFPYESFTTKYPPSKYPNYYVKIRPVNRNNSTLNWAGDPWVKPYVDFKSMYRALFDASGPEDTGPVDRQITIYFQTTRPESGLVRNDCWVDTDSDSGRKQRWSGNKWKDIHTAQGAFNQLMNTIPAAFVGTIKMTFTGTTPSSPGAYDIWINRPDGITKQRPDTNDAWNVISQPYRPQLKRVGIPLRLAQAGTIRLSQFAIYDKHGHVIPVEFHVSIYDRNSVTNGAMPSMEKDPDFDDERLMKYRHPRDGLGDNYKAGQRSPFVINGWEQIREDGTIPDNQFNLASSGASLTVAWGTYYEPAGYYPSRYSKGADPSGQLRDETSWAFDKNQIIHKEEGFDRKANIDDAMSTVMIYCQDQGDEPAFLMGRLFRQEPGTS